jgi:hypothetical protein
LYERAFQIAQVIEVNSRKLSKSIALTGIEQRQKSTHIFVDRKKFKSALVAALAQAPSE